jgi:hypothetical protein
MKQIEKEIFEALNEAQKIADANSQDRLFDLIEYNKDLLYSYDLDQQELKQLYRFASYSLETAKSYSLMIKNTLV